MLEGIIIKGIGGFYYVKTESGIYECKARGIFRKRKITPTVGDRAEISVSDGKGSIENIADSKNSRIRPPVAKIDILLIVVAAASPDPSLYLIDRMLVTAEKNSVKPVICINKTDIEKREDIKRIYESAGYSVVCVSASRGENMDTLKSIISGRITAFAGLSGVGKSTLLNILTNERPKTGGLSEKINRGKHTTRHVELMELDGGGYVFDTPGFSSVELSGIKANELYMYFPEIAKYEGECRFSGCVHIHEPDCAVKAALENGDISNERYESYCSLYEELKKIKEWK